MYGSFKFNQDPMISNWSEEDRIRYFYLYQQLNYIYGTNFLLSCSTQIGKTHFTKQLLQNADKMFFTPVDQININQCLTK